MASFVTGAEFFYIVIQGSDLPFENGDIAFDFDDFFVCLRSLFLGVFLKLLDFDFDFSNLVWDLFELIRGNRCLRARLSPDTVDFDCKFVEFLLNVGGFFWVFDDFGVQAVCKLDYGLFSFSFEGINFLVKLTIVFDIFGLAFLSEPFHFENDSSQLFDFLLILLTSIVTVVSGFIVQQFFIVLNSWF